MSAPEPKPLRRLYVRLPRAAPSRGRSLCARGCSGERGDVQRGHHRTARIVREDDQRQRGSEHDSAREQDLRAGTEGDHPDEQARVADDRRHNRRREIDGGNVETEHPELFIIGEGVSAKFKDIVISHAGAVLSAAIEDFGSLDVEGSTIAGTGPGITVQATGSLTVLNASIINGSGVGVIDDPGGSASFKNATIAFNKLGGITNDGTLSLTNTIIAENGEPECEGPARRPTITTSRATQPAMPKRTT